MATRIPTNDDPVIRGSALISQYLADALLASDELIERFKRDLAEKLSAEADAIMLRMLRGQDEPCTGREVVVTISGRVFSGVLSIHKGRLGS